MVQGFRLRMGYLYFREPGLMEDHKVGWEWNK